MMRCDHLHSQWLYYLTLSLSLVSNWYSSDTHINICKLYITSFLYFDVIADESKTVLLLLLFYIAFAVSPSPSTWASLLLLLFLFFLKFHLFFIYRER